MSIKAHQVGILRETYGSNFQTIKENL